MNHCSIGLWYVTKRGFYMMTSSVVGLRRSSQHFPKPLLQQSSWSLFGGLIPVWSTAAFWIPEKPLHLRSMLSKSMRCTKNCNTCSQQWSTERAQFSTIMPNCTLHNQHFKSWVNWATKFCLIRHIHLTSCQPITRSSRTACSLWGLTSPAFSPKGPLPTGLDFPDRHPLLSTEVLNHWRKSPFWGRK